MITRSMITSACLGHLVRNLQPVKGSVATSASLPPTGNTVGDLYLVRNTGHGWAWQSNLTWIDTGPLLTEAVLRTWPVADIISHFNLSP